MSELDLTEAIEAGRVAANDPLARGCCLNRAEAAVRAAAPIIERAVRERVAAQLEQNSKFWQTEYFDAPDGTAYEMQAAAKADAYESAAVDLREAK